MTFPVELPISTRETAVELARYNGPSHPHGEITYLPAYPPRFGAGHGGGEKT